MKNSKLYKIFKENIYFVLEVTLRVNVNTNITTDSLHLLGRLYKLWKFIAGLVIEKELYYVKIRSCQNKVKLNIKSCVYHLKQNTLIKPFYTKDAILENKII